MTIRLGLAMLAKPILPIVRFDKNPYVCACSVLALRLPSACCPAPARLSSGTSSTGATSSTPLSPTPSCAMPSALLASLRRRAVLTT